MEIKFQNGSYIKSIDSQKSRRPQTIEYTYELPEPTDEEIQKEIDEAGLTGIVKPEDVRKYIRERLYEVYSEAVAKKENANEI